MSERILTTGNEAAAEAAIRAGLHFYAGYPITPQNELTAYMAAHMPEHERIFIQSESELSAINMVFGASATGARAMTSSSSPGISLKQEGISYMAGCGLPGVIINVMRGGPGLGNISGSQSDYFQATRGGGHGDYRTIVYAPWSAQEIADMVSSSFDVAEKYRIPVMILFDGYLGQTMEPVKFSDAIDTPSLDNKDWTLTGCAGRKPRRLCSLMMEDGALESWNIELEKQYQTICENETRYEQLGANDPDVLLVAFGFSARQSAEAMDQLTDAEVKTGLFRPQTVWPFPSEALAKAAEKAKKVVVVEMNLGQMIEDVRLAMAGSNVDKIRFVGRSGGGVPSVREIMDACTKE